MMNPRFQEVLVASTGERRDLFIQTANRLGTTIQNIEKDFWVCWTLDALFNGLEPAGPRLLFKGGTSLSKAYGLIERFSEDIDITVFREDIGQPAAVAELAALSGKKRATRLDAIKAACQAYIHGSLRTQLAAIAERAVAEVADSKMLRIESADDDPDGQSLLVWYESVTTAPGDGYIRPAMKIESGAKSALDPHAAVIVTPYVSDELADRLDLSVRGVMTTLPLRTFWDKVVILHGLRRWYDRRAELRGGGQRVSRHYYDLHRLVETDVGKQAVLDTAMAADCALHARIFFNRPDFDLASAVPGSFALVPHDGMVGDLRRDYAAMATMIFGQVPSFDAILETIVRLEKVLNNKP